MNNKGILVIIAVAVIGIFAVLFVQANKKSPAEKVMSGVEEMKEEIVDEVDDHTDAK